MINVSLKKSANKHELRSFGAILGLLFVAGGAALHWSGKDWGVALAFLGLMTSVAFFWQWPGTRPFYTVWMRVALRIGQGMTLLLLTVLYLAVLTPIALLARVCGRHFLDRTFRRSTESYWQPCQENPCASQDEKQY